MVDVKTTDTVAVTAEINKKPDESAVSVKTEEKAAVVEKTKEETPKEVPKTIKKTEEPKAVPKAIKKTEEPKSIPKAIKKTEEPKEVKTETTIKTAAKNTTTAKKSTVEKKTTEKKAPVKKATTTKKQKAKKETAKKEPTTNVILQFAGKELSAQEFTSRAKTDWIASGHKEDDLKDITLYIKPEDNAVYYVANGIDTGSIDF